MINEMLEVMTALAHEGMTMSVVTHEMGFARKVARRMIFKDQGEVVQDCPTGDFFDRSSNRSERVQQFLNKVLAP